MAGEILDSLKNFATAQPEKAMQIIDDLRSQWASMTDEQKAQAREQLAALKGKLVGLTDEQRKAIAERIASLTN